MRYLECFVPFMVLSYLASSFAEPGESISYFWITFRKVTVMVTPFNSRSCLFFLFDMKRC